MAHVNSHYLAEAHKALLGQSVTLAGVPTVMLIDAEDYVAAENHKFLSDIPVAARLAAAPLDNPRLSAGKFFADDTSISSASGDPAEGVQIFLDTGEAATSVLVFYSDVSELALNGSGVTVKFSQVDGIFSL